MLGGEVHEERRLTPLAGAAATLVVRVALSAPPYVNATRATAGVAFALALSLTYHSFRDTARGVGEATRPPVA